jgi:hypothetical protein
VYVFLGLAWHDAQAQVEGWRLQSLQRMNYQPVPVLPANSFDSHGDARLGAANLSFNGDHSGDYTFDDSVRFDSSLREWSPMRAASPSSSPHYSDGAEQQLERKQTEGRRVTLERGHKSNDEAVCKLQDELAESRKAEEEVTRQLEDALSSVDIANRRCDTLRAEKVCACV